jgi:hypothetical protein
MIATSSYAEKPGTLLPLNMKSVKGISPLPKLLRRLSASKNATRFNNSGVPVQFGTPVFLNFKNGIA